MFIVGLDEAQVTEMSISQRMVDELMWKSNSIHSSQNSFSYILPSYILPCSKFACQLFWHHFGLNKQMPNVVHSWVINQSLDRDWLSQPSPSTTNQGSSRTCSRDLYVWWKGNLVDLEPCWLFKHWTKTYVPTTLGSHWVCIGNVLNPAN